MLPKGTNDIVLVNPDTNKPSGFRLREFQNGDGIAMVHSSVIASLERIRSDIAGIHPGKKVTIHITSGIRTDADLHRLAAQYGWEDEGGRVARDSKHLVKHGGIAVDFYVRVGGVIYAHNSVGHFAKRHFDWVKVYSTHVHGDNRNKGRQ